MNTVEFQSPPPRVTICTANKKFRGGGVFASGLEGKQGGGLGSAIKSAFSVRLSTGSRARRARNLVLG